MSTPHPDWFALLGLAVLLGLRHGFDADHLATIDGLTRFNLHANKPFARFCGALFALGHGAVVVAIAALAGALSTRWATPAWLETTAALISVFFLTLLGVLNLRAALAHEPGVPVGLRSAWIAKFRSASRPWMIVGVGALFAISFDTVNQAMVFALGGSLEQAVALGLAFAGGMLLTDGLNGLWISGLIQRADRFAAASSRLLGLAIASVSLTLAAFCATKFFVTPVDAWAEGKGLLLGAGVGVLMLAAYLITRLQRAIGTRT